MIHEIGCRMSLAWQISDAIGTNGLSPALSGVTGPASSPFLSRDLAGRRCQERDSAVSLSPVMRFHITIEHPAGKPSAPFFINPTVIGFLNILIPTPTADHTLYGIQIPGARSSTRPTATPTLGRTKGPTRCDPGNPGNSNRFDAGSLAGTGDSPG